MKNRRLHLVTLATLPLCSAGAADVFWDGGTTNIAATGDGLSTYSAGTWSTAIANWDTGNGSAHAAWTSGDSAIFAGTYVAGARNVTLGSNITVNQIKVNTGTTGANRYDILPDGGNLYAITFNGAYSTTTPSLDYTVPNNNLTARITGDLTTSGGLVIKHGSNATNAGSGRLGIYGANDFKGDVTLVAGNVDLTSNFGDSANKFIFEGGALSLALGSVSNTYTTARGIQVGTGGGNITDSSSGGASTVNLSGPIAGSGTLAHNHSGAGTINLVFSGDMSGFTGVAENRASGMFIQTTVTSGGAWKLTGGTLKLNTTDNTHIADGAGKSDLLMNGGTLDMNGKSETINGLSGSTGTVTNGAAATTSTLTLGAGDATATFGGLIQNGAGTVALTKIGTGTQTLSGNGTYTGPTTIQEGTLAIGSSSSLGASSSISLATGTTLDALSVALSLGSGQTLGGSGTLLGTVSTAAGSTLAPGSSGIGSLAVDGLLTLGGNSNIDVDKSGSTITSDQFTGPGEVVLGGVLNLNTTGTALAVNDEIQIFANGVVSGSFASIVAQPALPVGLSFDTSGLSINGKLRVVNRLNAPLFSPGSGGYAGAQSVTLTGDPGTTIHYSTDGSDPTSASPGGPSPLTITVPSNSNLYTVKALAEKSGQTNSLTSTAVYNTIDTPTWILNSSGFWSDVPGDEANWLNNVIAGGAGMVADFSTLALEQDITVTLEGSRTIGSMKFADANAAPQYNWTLVGTGASTLTLDGGVSQPVIEVVNQSATIGIPLVVTQGFIKTGAGTLNLNAANSYSGTTAINAGTLVSSTTNKLGTGPVTIGAAGTYRFTTTGNTSPTLSNIFSGAGTAVVNASSGNQPYYSGDWSGFSGTLDVLHAYQATAANHGSANMKLRLTNSSTYLGLFEGATTAVSYQAGELSGDAGTTIQTGTSVGGVITLEVGALGTNSTFAGKIINSYNGGTNSVIGLTKTGSGTLTLSGPNSYLGGTIVNAGTLELASGGELAFKPGANGVSNRITGTGTVTLNGTFNLNLAAANLTPGNSWNLVDAAALGETYGGTFNVADFTEASDVWTKTEGTNLWTFTEATGILELSTAAGYSTWATTHAGGQGPDLDFDGDGVKNGIEYFMGQTGSSFTALPVPVTAGGTTTVTWTRDPAATVTSFEVQYSTTLGNDWAPVPAGELDLTDPTKVIYTFPAPLAGKRFVRLSVTP